MPGPEHVMQCSKAAGHAGSFPCVRLLFGHYAVQRRLVGQHLRTAAGGLRMSSLQAAPAMPLPEAACRLSSAPSHPLSGALAHASRTDATEQPSCEPSGAADCPLRRWLIVVPQLHFVAALAGKPRCLHDEGPWAAWPGQCRFPSLPALPAACPQRPEPHRCAARHVQQLIMF